MKKFRKYTTLSRAAKIIGIEEKDIWNSSVEEGRKLVEKTRPLHIKYR